MLCLNWIQFLYYHHNHVHHTALLRRSLNTIQARMFRLNLNSYFLFLFLFFFVPKILRSFIYFSICGGGMFLLNFTRFFRFFSPVPSFSRIFKLMPAHEIILSYKSVGHYQRLRPFCHRVFAVCNQHEYQTLVFVKDSILGSWPQKTSAGGARKSSAKREHERRRHKRFREAESRNQLTISGA